MVGEWTERLAPVFICAICGSFFLLHAGSVSGVRDDGGGLRRCRTVRDLMPILNYWGDPRDRPRRRRFTWTEFVIVLTGAVVLMAILLVLYRLFVPP